MLESYLLLGLMLILGIVGKNDLVAIGSGAVLILKLCQIDLFFPLLEKYSLKLGIIMLIIAVITPIAEGKIRFVDIYETLKNPVGLLAIAAGIAAAYMGARGINLLTSRPEVITGVLIGTIIGVAFFRGVPVGPLIAAGMVALLIR